MRAPIENRIAGGVTGTNWCHQPERHAGEQFKWAFAAIGDEETGKKVLGCCWEAMQGKKLAEG